MATPNSQLAAELWPQILRRLERWQRNVGTGGGGSGTVTVEFTGTVTDAMAPQFVLRDGSRSLQGNLAVETGVTIDGVDISAHAADASAHHAPVTAGDGIGVTGQSVAVNSSVVRTARTVSAGDGLSGGGDLSANRSFAVSLATDPGLEFSGGALRAKIVTGDMTRTSSGLGVNRAIAPTWTAVHTFNASPVVNANLSFTGARSVVTDGSNALTLSPAGNLVINPGGDSRLSTGKEFRAQTFSDTPMATGGFRLFDQGSNVYRLTIGSLRADELHARVFVADEIRVDRGAEYWSKSFGIVETTTPFPAAYGIDTDVWFENAPGLGTANLFSANDWLLAQVVDWGSGLTLARAWFRVTSKTSSTATRQQWRIKWMAGTLPNDTLQAGTMLVDVGQSGQGWVHLSALSGDGGPFLQIGTWAGSDPYTPANVTARVRMGHLSGAAGYGTGKWGFAAGNNLALTPTTGLSGITAEATDGVRLHNTQIDLYEAGNLAVRMNQSHGLIFAQEADLEVNSRRALKWYTNPTIPSGPKGLISSFTSTGPLGGDTLYLTPASSVEHASIVLRANGSDPIMNGVTISGAGTFRSTTRYQARLGIEVYNPDAGPPHSPMAVGAAVDTAAQLYVANSSASRVGLRVDAAPSQTAALQEWRDSSGNRLARIGATGGLQSSFVNIADDAVATIYTDAVSGVLVFWLTGTTAGAQAGSVVLVRSGASGPHAVLLANGTAVEVTTSDVTGTTGTDGKYTISATATALKIENRLGGTRTFNWFRIS